jgi:hypothetical protein
VQSAALARLPAPVHGRSARGLLLLPWCG